MISRGSKGEEVKQWQEFLITLGHEIEADGIFGAKTQTATIAFQKMVALTADGIVGKNSYKKAAEKGYMGDYTA